MKLHSFSTRMMDIQNQMTERALEILALPEDKTCFLLDIGYVYLVSHGSVVTSTEKAFF